MSRLNIEGQLALLEALQCSILLEPKERLPIASEVLSRRKMQTLEVPELQFWLEAGDVQLYPFTKTFAQAKNDPFVCLHTSGSTRLPRAIILRHGTMTHHDLFLRLPVAGGNALNRSLTSNSKIFFGLPLFHSAGMCFMAYAIYSGTTVVFAPSYPVTAELANAAHASGHVDGSFLIPNVLTELTWKPAYLQNIRKLRYLTFGGAALSREVGDKLKDLTHLFVCFGTTETGFYALEMTDPEDWEYAKFSPFMGHELRPFADDLFEFYFVQQDDLRDFQRWFQHSQISLSIARRICTQNIPLRPDSGSMKAELMI